MQFSTLAYAVSLLSAISASPVQHIHKRDVVTSFVHVTQYVYENEHVFVDGSGVPISTSYEVVPSQTPTTATSTVFVTQQTSTPSSTSSVAPPALAIAEEPQDSTTSTSVPAVTTSSTTVVVPTTTSTPTTSSVPTSSAPASTGGSGQWFQGQATYFAPGLGACGITNSDSDFICALNHVQFEDDGNGNTNSNCFKEILITRGSAQVKVQVTDMCPGCNDYGLDLSPAAFEAIATEAEGRVDISWEWV
jgi:hypothetical protein